MGELRLFWDNRYEFQTALKSAGLTDNFRWGSCYWSSTERNDRLAWLLRVNVGYPICYTKSNIYFAVPFLAID